MARPSQDAAASHLAAVLLIATVAVAAPSLFEYALQLHLPIFGGLIAKAAESALPENLWFTVAAPLFKLIGLLLLLSIAAGIGSVSIRRALSR